MDGENLRHSICDLFPNFNKFEYLPRANWGQFFDWISESVTGSGCDRIRTYWYVVQNIDFYPFQINSAKNDGKYEFLYKILSRNKSCKDSIDKRATGDEKNETIDKLVEVLIKRKDAMQKRFNGWVEIQNTIARESNSVEFRRAGAIRFDLFDEQLGSEKAVDVKLATDLIKLKDIYDIAIILSGDQDYSPAVDLAKDLGKRIVNVSFLTSNGKLLPGGAKRLNQSTDWSFEVPYIDSKKYFNL